MSHLSTHRVLAPLTALGAGVLLACAFQPVDLPLLSIPAVATCSGLMWLNPWRRSAVVGAAFGLGFFGPLLWWLSASISPAAWAALTLVQATWFALLGAAVSAVRGLPLVTVWTALLWTAVEVVRSGWPLGGLPWGRLGFAALDTLWQGWLAWGGVSVTTFVVALLGAMLARLVMTRHATPRVAAVVVATISVTPAVAAASSQPATDGQARIAVVQGGVPGAGNRLVENHREVTDNHVRETAELFGRLRAAGQSVPDLVLWPENATAVDPDTDVRANTAIRDAARSAQTPILAGSISNGPGPGQARNQGIVWSSDGVPGQRYTKRHLVPFGEYVPWRAVATRVSDRVAEIPRDMVPGAASDPLDVNGLLIADALCFDVAYDDVIASQVRRGASLVTVQTSNAMFIGTAQLEQQWDISRVRALESGRSVVVSSVNGVSGAIGPDGRVLARLAGRVSTSAVVDVPLSNALTPAVALGAWPGRIAVVLAVLGATAAGLLRLRTGSTISHSSWA